MEQLLPRTYPQVRDLYETLGTSDPQFQGMSMPQFSGELNRLTGTQAFAAGLEDNVVKRLSYWVDKQLRPISDVTEQLGAALPGALGVPQFEHIGREMGKYLPRGMLETLSVFAAWPLRAASLAGKAVAATGIASATASGYTHTGSAAAGAVQGAATALLPPSVQLGGRLFTDPFRSAISKKVTTDVVEEGVSRAVTGWARPRASTGLVERLAEEVGRNFGAAVNMEAAIQGTSIAMGQGIAAFDDEHLAMLVAGTAPFTVLDMLRVLPRRPHGQFESPMRTRMAQDNARTGARIEAHLKTLREEVDDIVRTGYMKESNAKTATALRQAHEHVGKRIDQAIEDGYDLDLYEHVYKWTDGKEVDVRAQADIDNVVDTYVQRGILAWGKDAKSLQVIGKVDTTAKILADIAGAEAVATSQQIPSRLAILNPKRYETGTFEQGPVQQELPSMLKHQARTETFDPETGQPVYTDVELPIGDVKPPQRGDPGPAPEPPIQQTAIQHEFDPFTGAAVYVPFPSGVAKPVPAGRARPAEVQSIPRTLLEPEMPKNLTPDLGRQYLNQLWRYLKQQAGQDASKPLVRKVVDEKKPNQTVAVYEGQLPKPFLDLYVEAEKAVVMKLGMKSPVDLLPALPEAVQLPGTYQSFVASRQQFVKQVQELLGKHHPATARTLTGDTALDARTKQLNSIEPTMGESYAHLKSLNESIDTALRFAMEAEMSPEIARRIALLEAGGKGKKDIDTIRELKAQILKEGGKHKYARDFLDKIEEHYLTLQDELAARQGSLTYTELANRRYMIEMQRLRTLMEESFKAESTMQTEVDAALAKTWMGKGEVSMQETQNAMQALQRMEQESTPWGLDVVRALARVNADLTAITAQGETVRRALYTANDFQHFTDSLKDTALFNLFKRAAELEDPVNWAAAKAETRLRGKLPTEADNPAFFNEKVAEFYIRRVISDIDQKEQRKLTRTDVKQIYEYAMRDESGKAIDIDLSSPKVDALLRDPALAGLMEDSYVDKHNLVRKFEDGTPAAQALEAVRVMTRDANRNKLEWWFGARAKGQFRFDADGSVDWAKSQWEPIPRKGQPESVEKYNKLLEVIEQGEYPVSLELDVKGRLTVKLRAEQRYFDYDTAVMRMDFLRDVGALSQDRANAMWKVIGKNLDEASPADRTKILHEIGVGKYTEWMDQLQSAFDDWKKKTVHPMMELLSGKVLRQMESERPAMSQQVEVVIRPDVDPRLGSTEAALAMEFPGKDPIVMVRDAQSYFNGQWKKMGLTPEEGSFYTRVAMRVVAAFPAIDKGRIAHTARQGIWGEYVSGMPGGRFLVGVREGDEYARWIQGAHAPHVRASLLITTLAHELTHSVFHGKGAGLRLSESQLVWRDSAIKWADLLGPEGRATVYQRWAEIVEPHSVEIGKAKYAAESSSEFLADMGALMVKGFASPDVQTGAALAKLEARLKNDFQTSARKILGEAAWTDVHEQNFINGLYVSMLDVLPPLQGYFKRVAPNYIADMNPLIKSIKEAMDLNTERINEAMRMFDSLENVDRGRWEQRLAEGWLEKPYDYRMVRREFGHEDVPESSMRDMFETGARNLGMLSHAATEKHFGVTPNWYHKWLMTPHYLGRQFPQIKDVIDVVMRFRGMANDYATKIAAPFMTKPSLFGKVQIDAEGTGIKYIAKHPNAERAASAIALIKQASKQSLSDAQMNAISAKHGVKDEKGQAYIRAFHNAAREAAPRLLEAKVDAMRETLHGRYGQEIMNTHPDMPWRTAWDMAGIVEKGVWGRIAGVEGADAMYAQAMGMIDKTQRGLKQLASLETALKEVFEWQKDLVGDWYMPEVRLGEYMVAWRKGKEWGTAGFDDAAKMDTYIQKLEGDPTVSHIKPWRKTDRLHEFEGVDPDFAKTWNEIEKKTILGTMMESGLDDPAMKRFFDMYEPGEAAFRAQKDFTLDALKRERKLAPGRETINMPYAYMKHIQGTSNLMAKAITKAQAGMAMSDPAIRGNPALLNMAKDYFNMVLNPSAKEFSFLKRMTFAYYMGLNFSSMMIEGTQPLLMLAPLITRDTGSTAAGYKYMAAAAKALYTRTRNKVTGKGTSLGDANLNDVIKRAIDEQIVDFGISQEFQDLNALFGVNLRGMFAGKEGSYNPVSWSKTLLDKYAIMARDLYSNAPRLNSLLSTITLYKVATEHGIKRGGKLVKLDHEQAYNYVRENVRAATLGGGTAGRPLLFAKTGRMQGALGLMYSLMTYTFGMFSHMTALGLDSIDANKRLLPSERTAARKALAQTLGTQVFLAGAMGIPLAPGILALLQQLMPSHEVMKTVEDTISKMMGEDEEGGGIMTDFVMKGAPFAAGGVDLSSRMELSNVMGLSPFDGWQVSNLFGPFASMLENIGRAASQATQGDYGSAAESAIPIAWRNVVKRWRDDWQMRDGRDRLLLEPTGIELGMDIAGFRPARLNKMRDRIQMAKQGDKAWGLRNQAFHDEMAALVQRGDNTTVREKLLERQQSIAGYSAVAGAQSIVDRVLEQTFPYDFARDGARLNAAERQRLAHGSGVPQKSEMERLMTRKTLERGLGVPGAGIMNQSQVRMAQLVDQLMAQNPLLSKQEASQMAMLMMGRQMPGLLGQPRFDPRSGQQAGLFSP